MTVSITDKRRPKQSVGGLGLSNETWFAILGIPGMKELINTQRTNDEINASPAVAKKIAVLIAGWDEPEGWVNPPELRAVIKLNILEFMLTCNGFRTS